MGVKSLTLFPYQLYSACLLAMRFLSVVMSALGAAAQQAEVDIMLQVQVGGLKPMFILGKKGDSTCPDGSVKIKKKGDCNKAMKELEFKKMTKKKNKKDIKKHRLPFCWMKDGKVHFNKKKDVGSEGANIQSRLICKSEPEPECTDGQTRLDPTSCKTEVCVGGKWADSSIVVECGTPAQCSGLWIPNVNQCCDGECLHPAHLCVVGGHDICVEGNGWTCKCQEDQHGCSGGIWKKSFKHNACPTAPCTQGKEVCVQNLLLRCEDGKFTESGNPKACNLPQKEAASL